MIRSIRREIQTKYESGLLFLRKRFVTVHEKVEKRSMVGGGNPFSNSAFTNMKQLIYTVVESGPIYTRDGSSV